MKVKMFIDILMTVFVLMLMAYQATGEKLHEWLGTGMAVLFLAHNLLNIRWYGSLMKGKYSLLRIFRTVINFSVFVVMLALHWSMITGMICKYSGEKKSEVLRWSLRLIAVLIAAYGAVSFYQADILSYMFLKVEFASVYRGQHASTHVISRVFSVIFNRRTSLYASFIFLENP
jgi:Na+-transporting NADH:ubiquinone oxidoreductase subunit NqrE